MENVNEIWKDIAGYEGFYQVSNLGRVKSVERLSFRKNKLGTLYQYRRKEKILSLQVNKKYKYYTVVLCVNYSEKRLFVHKVVAQAFPEICGEWFEGCEVDHLDTITTNNVVSNLKVCTRSQNMRNPITSKRNSEWHKNRVGWKQTEDTKRKIGESNRKSQKHKCVAQYSLDGSFITTYKGLREMERQTGFERRNVTKCCNGKYHTVYGYKWEWA